MKPNTSTTEIKVGIDFGDAITPVGRLALRDEITYFEYLPSFIQGGLEISPFRLPLKPGLFQFDYHLFEGLPGVFSDSLPDGWGRLLFDRYLRSQGVLPSDITPLDRLAHVGLFGMGALVFEPDKSPADLDNIISLDKLAEDADKVLAGNSEEVIKELLALNGSSAGARPKALIAMDVNHKHIIHGARAIPDDYEHWLVKFPNTQDGDDAGAIEYIYALMAKEAGVSVPEVHLFPAQKGKGYFAVKRFDREGNKRLHMHTAGGLLHSDFRTPSLDYEDLINLTDVLTKDVREVKKMFRLAVFNVLAHNRDDHAKNFSFLMDEKGEWIVSPAYDLTFSTGPNGEQSTMVMGEGRNPGEEHLTKLGLEADLPKDEILNIIAQTKTALSQWEDLAKRYKVGQANIDLIRKKLPQS